MVRAFAVANYCHSDPDLSEEESVILTDEILHLVQNDRSCVTQSFCSMGNWETSL